MKITLPLPALKKSIGAFLRRFHVMIFVIIVLNGLTVTVFLLNSIIIKSGESGDYTPSSSSGTFDQATIRRIEELKTRDQTGDDLDLSDGRTNPFVE